jgi:O-acetyl-ADP-ribose deacetylase (regulator of RNase III)
MNEIRYVTGDATQPIGKGPKAICHIVNNCGAWGAGFVLAVSKRWAAPEKKYLGWHASDKDFGLGLIQPVLVEPSGPLWVINMIAQHGVGRGDGPPIRYKALRQCLNQVADFAERNGTTIHAPRIGCGLAGGDWAMVSKLIQETLTDKDYDVTIYDLAGEHQHQGKKS